VQADRAVQLVDFVARQIKQGQALAALGGVAARAERADVERRRLRRLKQRHVVELRVVRQRDDGAVRVELQLQPEVVGHDLGEGRAGHLPCEVAPAQDLSVRGRRPRGILRVELLLFPCNPVMQLVGAPRRDTR
jgi:hypothetical protein